MPQLDITNNLKLAIDTAEQLLGKNQKELDNYFIILKCKYPIEVFSTLKKINYNPNIELFIINFTSCDLHVFFNIRKKKTSCVTLLMNDPKEHGKLLDVFNKKNYKSIRTILKGKTWINDNCLIIEKNPETKSNYLFFQRSSIQDNLIYQLLYF